MLSPGRSCRSIHHGRSMLREGVSVVDVDGSGRSVDEVTSEVSVSIG